MLHDHRIFIIDCYLLLVFIGVFHNDGSFTSLLMQMTDKSSVSRSFENKHSMNLNDDENLQLLNLLGPKCQSIATAIVQLFFAPREFDYKTWKKHCVGVACFVKDSSKRSFFIRIFDLTVSD